MNTFISQYGDGQSGGRAATRVGPLTGAQQFEWWKLFNKTSHNVSLSFVLPQPLACETVTAGLRDLFSRHEALRTSFGFDESGEAIQRVHQAPESTTHPCPAQDGATWETFRQQLSGRAFQPDDPSLVRVGLLLDGGRVAQIHLVAGHAVFDGRSVDIVLADLAALFGDSGPLPAPDAAPQPIDSALSEREGSLAFARRTAEHFWREEVRALPNRLFVPRHAGRFQRYGAQYSSEVLPPALVAVARRYRASPSVVYTAAIQALLAVISGAPTTYVQQQFQGRASEERESVGCYHRMLPLVLDVSDRPSVGQVIERSKRRSLRVLSRYRVDHLTLRELLAREEERRGVSFARGTAVNFEHSPDLSALESRTDDELTAVLRTAAETELLMGRNELSPDRIGFDAYLRTSVSGTALSVSASFNAEVLTPDQMRALLCGPERILRTLLDEGDLSLDELAVLLGLECVGRDRSAVFVGHDSASIAAVTAAIEAQPGVGRAVVVLERCGAGPPRLVGYAESRDPDLDEGTLRDALLQNLRPGAPLVVPDRILLCAHLPRALAPAALREGGHAEPAVRSPDTGSTAAREALRAALAAAHGFEPDLRQSYVTAGCALLKAPYVLRQLVEAGYTGLGIDDFPRPVPLFRLAEALEPTAQRSQTTASRSSSVEPCHEAHSDA